MRFVGGNDGAVFLVDGSCAKLGTFQWGDQSAEAAALAKRILQHVLKDEDKALAYHRRYLHRVVAQLSKGQPWALTDKQVLSVVQDIEETEKETARDVRRMAAELPRGAVNAGMIPGRSEWGGTHNQSSREPELSPNIKRRT